MRHGRTGRAFVALVLGALVLAYADPRMQTTPQTADRDALQKQLKTVFDREMARRDPGACPDAKTTYDINLCVGNELGTTEENYNAYAATVRALLTSMPDPEPGLVAKFDESQKAWSAYRSSLCGLTYDWFAGGTAASSMAVICHLTVTRGHMNELNATIGANLMH